MPSPTEPEHESCDDFDHDPGTEAILYFDGDLTVVLGAFNTVFGPTVDDVETFSYTSGHFQVNINQFASTGGVKSVPEPATILGLLSVGSLGLATKRKRKSA